MAIGTEKISSRFWKSSNIINNININRNMIRTRTMYIANITSFSASKGCINKSSCVNI